MMVNRTTASSWRVYFKFAHNAETTTQQIHTQPIFAIKQKGVIESAFDTPNTIGIWRFYQCAVTSLEKFVAKWSILTEFRHQTLLHHSEANSRPPRLIESFDHSSKELLLLRFFSSQDLSSRVFVIEEERFQIHVCLFRAVEGDVFHFEAAGVKVRELAMVESSHMLSIRWYSFLEKRHFERERVDRPVAQ